MTAASDTVIVSQNWWGRTSTTDEGTQNAQNSCSWCRPSRLLPSGSTAVKLVVAAIFATVITVSILAIIDRLPADLTATYAVTALAGVGFIGLIAHLVKTDCITKSTEV